MFGERLEEILTVFDRLRIAVLGDFFLDKYLHVDPSKAEVSIETGKTAHQVVDIRRSPGAAGTVVCNLAALGVGSLQAIGFCGDDGEGYDLRKGLAALGCTSTHLHTAADRRTPTYLKPRDQDTPGLEGEHNRYDTKNRRPAGDAIQQAILDSLDLLLPDLDAVIVLDQVEEAECGVVTAKVRDGLSDRAGRWPNVVFWADSRLRIRRFRSVLIKSNQFEAVGMENPPPGEEIEPQRLLEAAAVLRSKTGAPVFVTRGSHGMYVTDPEPTLVPGVTLSGPIDPTGAGDSATAGAVAALCAGATLPEAALVGNLVASLTVEQLATTGTASRSQVRERLAVWQSQRRGQNVPTPGTLS
jgi:bifunctional ADP-heptose synthase (sugar kinase/adenylyltransferase)